MGADLPKEEEFALASIGVESLDGEQPVVVRASNRNKSDIIRIGFLYIMKASSYMEIA